MSLLAQYSHPLRPQKAPNSNQSSVFSQPSHLKSQLASTRTQCPTQSSVEIKEKRALVGPQLVLATPYCTMWTQWLQRELDHLVVDASQSNIIRFIRDKTQAQDLGNLQKVEAGLWDEELRSAVEEQLRWGESGFKAIEILASLKRCQQIKISRLQVLNILGSMLLGIMPPQAHTGETDLASLMRKQKAPPHRLHKLKSVIKALGALRKSEFASQPIAMQRIYCPVSQQSWSHSDLHPVKVELRGQEQPIQIKSAALVVTSNELGKWFRHDKWGTEEQLIANYPELLVAGLLCPQLNENQVLLVEDVEGISETSRLETIFKADECDHQSFPAKTITVAAAVSMPRPSCQYQPQTINQQISNMTLAVRAVPGNFVHIDTTLWGYVTDPVLQFCLTWIACSFQGATMTFTVTNPELHAELRMLAKEGVNLPISHLLNIFELYFKDNRVHRQSLLEYLKDNL